MGAGVAAGDDDTMLECGTAAQRTVTGARGVVGAVGPAVTGGASSDGQQARMCNAPSAHAGGQQGFRT